MTPDGDQYEAEQERIRFRRKSLGLEKEPREPDPKRPWGLALSGGGIRSATFCLGVLQALARARPPSHNNQEPSENPGLLPRFDYLSTVSGGGYIGAFFSSLFQPGRLHDQKVPTPETLDTACETRAYKAALDAYEVLRYEPPGRITTASPDSDPPIGKGPSAWLRENGRYLTPTGSGDMFYALAMTWRNWLSLHFVIGMPLLLVLTLVTLAKGALQTDVFNLSIGLILLLPLPFVLAYWLAIPGKNVDERPRLLNICSIATAAVAMVFAASGHVSTDPFVSKLCLAAATLIALSFVIYGALLLMLGIGSSTPSDDGLNANNVRNYRIHITRWLSSAIIVSATLLALAFVVTLAGELYAQLFTHNWITATSAGLLPVLIWIVRKLAWLKDEKPLPDWMLKLPLDALAMAGGVLMVLVLCLVWALFAQWIA
ncbi:patatin-like phospholipase family protein [Pseudomonas vancouverensis]|uniref:patatin-like phospholipase family protein n=1 Tax=Pseudomonas vancouverensis TaxID=95300 RepID=UPI003D017D52